MTIEQLWQKILVFDLTSLVPIVTTLFWVVVICSIIGPVIGILFSHLVDKLYK